MNINSYQNLPVELSLGREERHRTYRQAWEYWQGRWKMSSIRKWMHTLIKSKKEDTVSANADAMVPDTGNPMLDLYYLEGMKLFKQGPYANEKGHSREE